MASGTVMATVTVGKVLRKATRCRFGHIMKVVIRDYRVRQKSDNSVMVAVTEYIALRADCVECLLHWEPVSY